MLRGVRCRWCNPGHDSSAFTSSCPSHDKMEFKSQNLCPHKIWTASHFTLSKLSKFKWNWDRVWFLLAGFVRWVLQHISWPWGELKATHKGYTGYTGYRWVVEATPDQHPLECSSVRKVHESWRLGRTHQCQRFWTLLAQLILYFIQLSPLIILCKKNRDGLFLEKSGSPYRNCVLWCSLSLALSQHATACGSKF